MMPNSWRARLPRGACSPLLASWLTEPTSLTARCLRNSRAFRVRLLHFGKGRALADEGLTSAGQAQPVWIREVVLECDGVPVIFAHTTLAASSRGRVRRWLARLGSRSLGSLLFAYPGFSRGGIEFLRLDARHPLYWRASRYGLMPPFLWARRSSHRLKDEVVRVTEVFLPAIESLANA
ncbi:MAG: chorismate lyase [Rhodocyclales bacterium GT-UBC]|nr:MAG: chorismate lyase [Rhodocyclales bacterium GT-UBC]